MNESIGQASRFLDRHLPPACKLIFIINVAVFIVCFISSVVSVRLEMFLMTTLGEIPELSIGHLYLWQFLTYMFVHFELMHIGFNMLVFWFFAPTLESRLGTRSFWRFYLICGVGAGLIQAAITLLFAPHVLGEAWEPLVGASGAIMGLLLAYAAYYPNQVVYLEFLFPIKMKHFLIVVIALEVLTSDAFSRGHGGNISHLTHLGGLVVGYVWMAIYHRDWDIRHWQWQH